MSAIMQYIRDPANAHLWSFRGSYWPEIILPAEIVSITFTAHEPLESYTQTNHWSAYLTLSTTESVRLEVADYDDQGSARVTVQLKAYPFTRYNVCAITAPVAAGTTIERVLHLIITKRRDHYRFRAPGKGCRHWLSVFAADVASEHIISQDKAREAIQALQMYWSSSNTPPVFSPMAPGEWF